MSRRVGLLAVALALAGCQGGWFGGPDEPPLPGERIAVLSLDRSLSPDPRIQDLDVRLPPPFDNADWPQSGGYASHAMHHLAAPGPLNRIWGVSIGAEPASDTQLLSRPVIVGDRVYVMDGEATVRALDRKSGATVWSAPLGRDTDEEGVLSGGLAVASGRVYATTGFAQVVSLDAATGKVIWRRDLPGPMRAAPTVVGNRLFVITIANEVYSLDVADGHTLWTYAGLAETAGLMGGAAPAADEGVVVAPLSSGELIALRGENGRVLWTETLTALRRTDPMSSLPHIHGTPAIDRGRVYAVSHSGRTVAIDLRTGGRIWEQPVGGGQGPWVAGDFVYIVSDNGEVACLSARDGRVRWVRPLARYEDPEDRSGALHWVGPVLVGDRLLLANNTGAVVSVSPYTGDILGRIDLGEPVLLPPSVADGTVYFLTNQADLIALR